MISSRSLLVVLQILFLLGFFSQSVAAATEAVGKRGKIQGESHVNLRSGPDFNSPSVAVLRNGDGVTVEEEVKSWYRVLLADGQKGYVHKTLVGLVVRSPEAAEPAKEEKAKVEKTIPQFSPPEPPPQVEEPASEVPEPEPEPYKSPQLSQWKGWWLMRWVGGIGAVFVLGWIFGGNYYLRRDRIRVSRLHL